MKRRFLCSAIFFSAFTFLVTPAQSQGTGICCGKVGAGTTTISDGSGSGGQELYLDVAGAAGATHYCDENGLNCFTASSVGGVSDDSLDFTKFLDAMALDASTSITTDNAEVLSIVNTGTGNSFLVEDQASDTTPFVIDAAGNVGIGTSSPLNFLNVQDNRVADGTLHINSRFGHDANNTGRSVYIGGMGTDGVVFGNSAGLRVGTYGNDDFGIYTSNSLRIKVLSTGNVGIGTTAPSSLLDLQKAGTAKANTDIFEITNSGNAADMDGTSSSILFNQYYNDGTPAVADAAQITVGTETDWTSTASTQDSYLALSTALDGTVAEKMRITSAGNVGINTTSPAAWLGISSSASGDGRKMVQLYNPNATGGTDYSTVTMGIGQAGGGPTNGAFTISFGPQINGGGSNKDFLSASYNSSIGSIVTLYNLAIYGKNILGGPSNINTTAANMFEFSKSPFLGDYVATTGTYNIIQAPVSTTNPSNQDFQPTSGTAIFNVVHLNPAINQTGGANGITRGLYINPTLTAAADWRSIDLANNSGFGLYQSGANATNYLAGAVGIGTPSPTELFDINSSTMRLRTAKTPASASDTCDQGEIAWDADYVYVCVATNTWKRSGLATW
jgi:hypothetical protein